MVLIINCGSSSLKVSLFTSHYQRVIDINQKEKNWEEIEQKLAPYRDMPLVIGHRFVHGGKEYRETTALDKHLLSELSKLVDMAPLHNKPCLEGILWCISYFGDKTPQYVVFDTSFYKDMPPVATHYAIAQKYGIQRFGFHGISHEFLWQRYKEEEKGKKVITLHLGGGCSATAIDNGKPIETSMGFSPLEGLVMGTRSGDIDPQVFGAFKDRSIDEILYILNFESGLLGVSGTTADMQKLVKTKSQFAIDLFCHRLIKYIGGYIALLGGIDALVFSGGIGENCHQIRSQIINALSFFGFILDEQANQMRGSFQKITKGKVPAFVIATDENLAIAKQKRVF